MKALAQLVGLALFAVAAGVGMTVLAVALMRWLG